MTKSEAELKCGLLGRRLTHSFSPLIHSFAGSYGYLLFEQEPENVDDFIKNGDYDCINVTIPYKENAYRLCDVLSDEAAEIKAVNTMVRKEGKLYGYNTDYYGFVGLLKKNGIDVSSKKCIVLGSGGASKMAVYALSNLGASYVKVVSRTGDVNYGNVYNVCTDAEIIVNTTPVWMYPNIDDTPIDIAGFSKCEAVVDIIYNPSETKLLHEAKKLGIRTANGLYMLAAQGIKAASFFTGRDMPEELSDKVCKVVEAQTKNVVLIGMPGCGKSYVGSKIASILNREFIDIDKVIEEREKRTIPDIFAVDGEEYFRKVESAVTAEFCGRSGLVISTGGGVVTREENCFPVRCNSVVCWIKRDIRHLPTAGRPVSEKTSAEALFAARREKYKTWCDYSFDIKSSEQGISEVAAEECAGEIVRVAVE